MKAVLVLVALLIATLRVGAVDRSSRPTCSSEIAEKCSVLVGSTDTSGFVVFALSKNNIAEGTSIGKLMFRQEKVQDISCELRPEHPGYPRVTALTSRRDVEIVSVSMSRFPRQSRWAYVCKE